MHNAFTLGEGGALVGCGNSNYVLQTIRDNF